MATGEKHVMISYQWDYQQTILKIRDKLKSDGFKVWIDVENMCTYTSLSDYPHNHTLTR